MLCHEEKDCFKLTNNYYNNIVLAEKKFLALNLYLSSLSIMWDGGMYICMHAHAPVRSSLQLFTPSYPSYILYISLDFKSNYI